MRTKMLPDEKARWEEIHTTKGEQAVSWYRPHLEASLTLIERAAGGKEARIIDVGGGRSTLVDDLLARGYENITILEIAAAAVEATKARLGAAGGRIRWLIGDVTEMEPGLGEYDVWHDRALFHFLTTPEKRAAYIERARDAVRPGGHVIISTFGPQGPKECSGFAVKRYDAESLHREFGARFRLVESSMELHQTPMGSTQQFLYVWLQSV